MSEPLVGVEFTWTRCDSLNPRSKWQRCQCDGPKGHEGEHYSGSEMNGMEYWTGPVGKWESTGWWTDPAQANARLIAAAPDLLEACERAETGISDWLMGKGIHPEALDYCRSVLADVRAAIKKASA